MVLILVIPRMEQTFDQTKDVNFAPRYEVSRAVTPNLETQLEIKARAQVSAVMEERETASGHLEVLSIIVIR